MSAPAPARPARPGRPALLLAAVLVLCAAAACDDDGITLPGNEPAQTGVIVEIDARPFGAATGAAAVQEEDDDGRLTLVPRSIWVKEDPAEACGIVWTLDAGTDVLVRTGSALRRAVDGDLAVDRPVRVWTDGAIAESCPAQGLASAVELR